MLKQAFENTFNRAISDQEPVKSILSGFFGWQYKYKRKKTIPMVFADLLSSNPNNSNTNQINREVETAYYNDNNIEESLDKNVYNWLEQLAFPLRLAKNILKLVTEFVWRLAIDGSDLLEKKLASNTQEATNVFAWIGYGIIRNIIYLLGSTATVVLTVGEAITSPIAALKRGFLAGNILGQGLGLIFGLSPRSTVSLGAAFGLLLATIRGLISLLCYGTIAVFAAPALAAILISSGSVGSQIAMGLAAAANWIGALPLVGIGSGLAIKAVSLASAFGANLASGLVSAVTAAAATMTSLTIIVGLRALLRYFSPFKPSNVPAPAPDPDLFADLRRRLNQARQGFTSGVQQSQLPPPPALGSNAEHAKRLGIKDEDLPDDMQCPITFELMTNPAYFRDRPQGVASRAILEYCLLLRNKDPLTNVEASKTELVSDTALEQRIKDFLTRKEAEAAAATAALGNNSSSSSVSQVGLFATNSSLSLVPAPTNAKPTPSIKP